MIGIKNEAKSQLHPPLNFILPFFWIKDPSQIYVVFFVNGSRKTIFIFVLKNLALSFFGHNNILIELQKAGLK
jgi:hypothetical protein